MLAVMVMMSGVVMVMTVRKITVSMGGAQGFTSLVWFNPFGSAKRKGSVSANYWETKRQWCRSLWHHEEWSPRRPASSHACARCSKIEASRPCSQPSPQRAACYHSALLPQGLACWGSLSSPIIWDPSIARRLNPSLFLHQHKASSVPVSEDKCFF